MSTLGKTFTRKTRGPAFGTVVGNRRTVAVGFDQDDFNKISDLAQHNEVAFQEQVRRLCKQALSPSPRAASEDRSNG